ncbi:hypothetical protein GOC35_19835 [Sinorhizobium meliloti]|nr:hypothetical protein [Sinorhizobium meliloti]
MKRKVTQTTAFDCGDGEHQVVSLNTSAGDEPMLHRREPCEECSGNRTIPQKGNLECTPLTKSGLFSEWAYSPVSFSGLHFRYSFESIGSNENAPHE